MFAPPICRRRWRNNAFRSARSDEDGDNPATSQRAERAIQQGAIARAAPKEGKDADHDPSTLARLDFDRGNLHRVPGAADRADCAGDSGTRHPRATRPHGLASRSW